ARSPAGGGTRTAFHGTLAAIASSNARNASVRSHTTAVTEYPAACSASASFSTRGLDVRLPGLTMHTARLIAERSPEAEVQLVAGHLELAELDRTCQPQSQRAVALVLAEVVRNGVGAAALDEEPERVVDTMGGVDIGWGG